jgi:tRNA-uridine 2-sulfurtransferase
MNNNSENQVVVAMSGGVDSSVAALLLHQQGIGLIGVSMQVWDYRKSGGCESKASCCAPDDFTDARSVANKIGVPYYVFDFEKSFKKEVIDYFVSQYESGLTPNPCVECNNKVKFRELRDRAKALGCNKVATGHYAQIAQNDSEYKLLRAKDRTKDQSYFLYGIKAHELSETLFPVGHLTKPEVRELARSAGLVTAEKPESQDICFVSGKVSDFLVKLGAQKKRGDIVTKNGNKISEHDGIQNYTVGQRRGLGIGGSEQPLYVLEIDRENNRVIVGEKSELEKEYFYVHELSWANDKYEKLQYPYSFSGYVQVRSRHPGVEAEIIIEAKDKAKVLFKNDWATVSPGQIAAFYDENNLELFGGGKIFNTDYTRRIV